jgi:hypothetical protein
MNDLIQPVYPGIVWDVTAAFSGTNGTALDGHATDKGGKTWVDVEDAGWAIQGGKASVTNSTGTPGAINESEPVSLTPLILSSGLADTSTTTCEVTIRTTADGGRFGIAGLMARLPADGTWDKSGYLAAITYNDGDGLGLILYRMENGESDMRLVVLQQWGSSINADTDYRIKLMCSFTAIVVEVNDVVALASTDGTYGSARTGMGIGFESDASPGTQTFDNFRARAA